MPTTRPRYQVTETPKLARVLDRAATRWPGESRSKLLYAAAFGPDYLKKLRADWPA